MSVGQLVEQRTQRPLYVVGAVSLGLSLLVFTYAFAGAGALTVAIPIIAVAVGCALFWLSGTIYIEYMVWVWLLTPFVRRVVDYAQGAYTPTSLIIATPVLVGAVCMIPLAYALVRGRLPVSSPLVIPLAALGFAFIVGLIRNGAAAASYDLLSWSVPIAVGYHFAQNWRRYPQYRHSMRRVFMMGGLVLGLYGIVQFVFLLPWDQFWMQGSGVTFGKPEPFKVKVFGTLNSPGPYGMAMMAAVTMLTVGGNAVALAPAVVGLLLSLVRAAWGGLFLTIIWIAAQAGGRERKRLLGVIAVGVLLALPLLRYEPVQTQVGGRAGTITALEENHSAQARAALYTGYGPRIVVSNPLGLGLGSIGKVSKRLTEDGIGTFDSGILAVPLVLGIPGMLVYYYGLGSFIVRFVWRKQTDPFLRATSGLALAILAMLVFANQLVNFAGVLLWSCIGLTVAGRTYRGEA